MCSLCGTDEEKRDGVNQTIMLADDLKMFSSKLRSLAHGDIKPHSERSKEIASSARHIIRELVKDWL